MTGRGFHKLCQTKSPVKEQSPKSSQVGLWNSIGVIEVSIRWILPDDVSALSEARFQEKGVHERGSGARSIKPLEGSRKLSDQKLHASSLAVPSRTAPWYFIKLGVYCVKQILNALFFADYISDSHQVSRVL